MKKIRLIIALCLCSLLLICMTACGSELSKPEDFKFDIATQTLSWDKVAGAKVYIVEIDGKEFTTRANSYSLAKLDAGTYDIKVKAISDNEEVEDSEWAVYEGFERAYETGLMYKLINNNTEYELVGVGSAKGDVVMEDVYRGKPVTSIADSALRNNRFTSFTISKNVKSIGKNAFQNSQQIVELVIPETVTSVGDGLVQGSKKLEKVTLPQGIVHMPQSFAANCINLKEFVASDNLVSVGANAFSYCGSLQSVVFPDSVKTIGENAFFRCEGLTSVDLGGAEFVGKNAFSKCVYIEQINFGECLETVSPFAFYECESVTSIALPDTVKTIGERAFNGMKKLEKVELGDSLESVGPYAFHGTQIYANAPDGKDTTDGGVVVIDGWIIGCKNSYITTLVDESAVGVADYAFATAMALNTVYLPSVKYVGSVAFSQCPALVNAIFDNALLKIGDNAFYRSTALINVTLGNSLTHIGDYAFYECQVLAGLLVPDSVERIGCYVFSKTNLPASDGIIYVGNTENPNLWAVGVEYRAINNPVIKDGTKGIANYTFTDCGLVMDVTLPDSLEYIGRGAFFNCSLQYLMSINLPMNLKEIDDYAFYNCMGLSLRAKDGTYAHDFSDSPNLERIGRSAFYNSAFLGCNDVVIGDDGFAIPAPGRLDLSGIEFIGDYAFFNASGVESLYIGNGVQSIGNFAFVKSQSLKEVTISSTVKEMGNRVFYKCEALESVIIGNGLKEVPDYAFYDCVSLKTVMFATGGGIEHIGKYAFRGCVKLESINFGDSLKSIDNYAFFNCGLTELVVPETVETIGNYAFRGCKTLRSVVIPDTLVSMGKHTFYGLDNTTIYCEAEGIPAYWNERWNTSFRPVVWGCTLSEDNKYVVSVNKTAEGIINPDALNGVTAPVRFGYTFAGWTTVPEGTEAEYAAEEIAQAPDGTTLYAIWTPNA